MEDAGCPLRNLRKIVACIGKTSTGLSSAFSAGMVHRDVSTGNLLVSEVEGELICKITDLEYAKKVDANSQFPQDNKTGTPYFMALEIWRGEYLFRPPPPTVEIPQDFDDPTFLSRWFENVDDDLATSPPFRYNYLHDLESLFWILMYFVLIMHPVDGHINKPDIRNRMRKFFELFPTFSDFDYLRRIEFLQGNQGIRAQFLRSVPSQFVVTMRFAIIVSDLLRMEYKRIEALPDSTIVRYSATLYEQLQDCVATLANCDEKQVWLGDMFDMTVDH